MIAIIDYGVGNLFSLASSVKAVGEKAVVTSAPEVIRQAERIIYQALVPLGMRLRSCVRRAWLSW